MSHSARSSEVDVPGFVTKSTTAYGRQNHNVVVRSRGNNTVQSPRIAGTLVGVPICLSFSLSESFPRSGTAPANRRGVGLIGETHCDDIERYTSIDAHPRIAVHGTASQQRHILSDVPVMSFSFSSTESLIRSST